MHGQFNYVTVVADKLKLIWCIVKGTRKIAFFNTGNVATIICRKIQTKYQTMFYQQYIKKFKGKTYQGLITMAYDEKGKRTTEFINTDIKKDTSFPTLEKYNFISGSYYISVKGAKNNKVESMQQLLKDRKQYMITGKL